MEKPKLEVVPNVTPSDAQDIEALWLDPKLGDGITDAHWHTVLIGKPRDFFRVHPDPAFRPPNGNIRAQTRGCDRGAALYPRSRHARPAVRSAPLCHRRLCPPRR